MIWIILDDQYPKDEVDDGAGPVLWESKYMSSRRSLDVFHHNTSQLPVAAYRHMLLMSCVNA